MVGGRRYDGFRISRGIRQGCPLSPLLFSVASDLLLRRLARFVPVATRRAYADDFALVHGDVLSQAGTLCSLFLEYERVSGLRLNIQKTVLVPLFRYEPAVVRARLQDAARDWGGNHD